LDPRGLIKLYNQLVGLMVEGKFRPSYGRRGGFKQFTAKNLEQATELLGYLEDREWDPLVYLAGAFGSHNWCYQPKFERLLTPQYKKLYHTKETWAWWSLLKREDRFADKPEGVHPGHEIIRQRYFATHGSAGGELCHMEGFAGRFDARSKFCPSCPRKDDCR